MAKKSVAQGLADDTVGTKAKPKEEDREYGTVSFAPRCPYCGEECKATSVRGPLAWYRCENHECEQYQKYRVKVPRPWRPAGVLAGSSRQMNLAARENM